MITNSKIWNFYCTNAQMLVPKCFVIRAGH